MTDRIEGRWSISQESPLSGYGARLGPQIIPDGYGPNGDRMLVALICAIVLSTG